MTSPRISSSGPGGGIAKPRIRATARRASRDPSAAARSEVRPSRSRGCICLRSRRVSRDRVAVRAGTRPILAAGHDLSRRRRCWPRSTAGWLVVGHRSHASAAADAAPTSTVPTRPTTPPTSSVPKTTPPTRSPTTIPRTADCHGLAVGAPRSAVRRRRAWISTCGASRRPRSPPRTCAPPAPKPAPNRPTGVRSGTRRRAVMVDQ